MEEDEDEKAHCALLTSAFISVCVATAPHLPIQRHAAQSIDVEGSAGECELLLARVGLAQHDQLSSGARHRADQSHQLRHRILALQPAAGSATARRG